MPFFTVTCVSGRMDYQSFESCWIRNIKKSFEPLAIQSCLMPTSNGAWPGFEVSASESCCDLQKGDTTIVMHSNIKIKRIGKAHSGGEI